MLIGEEIVVQLSFLETGKTVEEFDDLVDNVLREIGVNAICQSDNRESHIGDPYIVLLKPEYAKLFKAKIIMAMSELYS